MKRSHNLILVACLLVASAWGEPDPSYAVDPGYGYAAPEVRFESGSSCAQCKPTTRCTAELEVRDSDIPKEVPIPYIDYQTVYKDKAVRVVTDFDIQENPVPKRVQLQDEHIRVQPSTRTIEKVVVVRVPRVRENVVYKKIDRVKVVTEYRTKPKVIKIQHTRQVPDTTVITERKDVVRKRLVPETERVPLPVRIANIVEPDIVRVDKPVQVPTIQYRFCEKIQEIQVKGNCPPVPTTTTTTTPRPRVVGYTYDRPAAAASDDGWVPAPVRRFRRYITSLFE